MILPPVQRQIGICWIEFFCLIVAAFIVGCVWFISFASGLQKIYLGWETKSRGPVRLVLLLYHISVRSGSLGRGLWSLPVAWNCVCYQIPL